MYKGADMLIFVFHNMVVKQSYHIIHIIVIKFPKPPNGQDQYTQYERIHDSAVLHLRKKWTDKQGPSKKQIKQRGVLNFANNVILAVALLVCSWMWAAHKPFKLS